MDLQELPLMNNLAHPGKRFQGQVMMALFPIFWDLFRFILWTWLLVESFLFTLE